MKLLDSLNINENNSPDHLNDDLDHSEPYLIT